MEGSAMRPFISERQETILALVVHEYVGSAQPVGSKRLVTLFSLGVSPATVRSEMASLSEAGLLRQPHVSAGRVPTEEGYRYFVRRLLGEIDLPADEKHTISHQFHQAGGNLEEWLSLAASVLAKHTSVASLVTTPHAETAIFKHLELISTHGRQVLMVLVLRGGGVNQQVLMMDQNLPQSELSELAAEITRESRGMDAKAVARHARRARGLKREVIALAGDLMARTDTLSAREIYRDGLTNVLEQPEFAESERARNALRLLEERTFLEEVMSTVLAPSVAGVQVIIGGNGNWEELKECSIVLARYGAEGFATGALGVLGPTRMAYGRTISTVRYVARILSRLVRQTFSLAG